jgi:hypothetical protein
MDWAGAGAIGGFAAPKKIAADFVAGASPQQLL